MLRSDKELALNDILTDLKDAADLYGQAVDLTEAPDLAGLFRELHRVRRNQASQLEAHIRELGYFPAEPHRDRETIKHLFWRFKATVSANQGLLLTDRFQETEKRIERHIEKAFQAGFPPPTREMLDFLSTVTQGVRNRLFQARAHVEKKAE